MFDEFAYIPKAVVVADGDFPRHGIPCSKVGRASFVACCDGALMACFGHGVVPDLIVGDGDSISPLHRQRYADRFVCITEQDTNDLTKTITCLKKMGYQDIAIVGATGKRECHTLGNISLLMEYFRMGIHVSMFTDYCYILPCRGKSSFRCKPGQQVSLFNFGARNFQSEGLKFPIYDFTEWWQGTLNETTGKEFTVSAERDYMVMVDYFC
jgi:thiamine pyrophosphokinase